jgi:hypothetical protein
MSIFRDSIYEYYKQSLVFNGEPDEFPVEFRNLDEHPLCEWRVIIDGVRTMSLDRSLTASEAADIARRVRQGATVWCDPNASIIIEKW